MEDFSAKQRRARVPETHKCRWGRRDAPRRTAATFSPVPTRENETWEVRRVGGRRRKEVRAPHVEMRQGGVPTPAVGQESASNPRENEPRFVVFLCFFFLWLGSRKGQIKQDTKTKGGKSWQNRHLFSGNQLFIGEKRQLSPARVTGKMGSFVQY